MIIKEIIETHLISAFNGSETRCGCDHTWRTNSEYRAHMAEALETHMKERESEAWEHGETAGTHNTVQRLRMIQMSEYEPIIVNPYEDEGAP